MVKAHVGGEKTTVTFAYMHIGAKFMLRLAEESESGQLYTLVASLVFSAFTLEAYLNHLGKLRNKEWGEIERKYPKLEKYKLFTEAANIKVDFNVRPYRTLILSACVAGPTYLGRSVSEEPFKVDGGKTVNLPITSAGALPAENNDYKIEGAGFSASLKNGSPNESQLTWAFSFVSKNSAELDSVIVEQVTAAGGLDLVVKDDSPTLKNKNWVGRSTPRPMTRDLSPWLYSGSGSAFVFKFTIRERNGSSIAMYQPSIISSEAKIMYLRVISGN